MPARFQRRVPGLGVDGPLRGLFEGLVLVEGRERLDDQRGVVGIRLRRDLLPRRRSPPRRTSPSPRGRAADARATPGAGPSPRRRPATRSPPATPTAQWCRSARRCCRRRTSDRRPHRSSRTRPARRGRSARGRRPRCGVRGPHVNPPCLPAPMPSSGDPDATGRHLPRVVSFHTRRATEDHARDDPRGTAERLGQGELADVPGHISRIDRRRRGSRRQDQDDPQRRCRGHRRGRAWRGPAASGARRPVIA